MKISLDIRVGFPRLADWIDREIPACRDDQRIFQAFVRFGEFVHTPELAAQALANNGLPPTIDVAITDVDGLYLGAVRKCHLNKILIRRKWGRKFNREAKDRHGLPDSSDHLKLGNELFMKAIILHEMVHWADWRDGQNQPNRDVWDAAHGRLMKNADVGFQFEEEAFSGIYSDQFD